MSAAVPERPARRRRGRPPCCPTATVLYVMQLRKQGLSLSRICAVLNSEAVPTPGGGSIWRKATVDRLLHALWVRDLDSGG